MSDQVVIGCDPGKSGALVLLPPDRTQIELVKMPTYKTYVEVTSGRGKKKVTKRKESLHIDYEAFKLQLEKWVMLYPDCKIILEEQRGFTHGKANSSMSETLINYGILVGICYGLGIKPIRLEPREWQSCYPTLPVPPDIQCIKFDPGNIKAKHQSLTWARVLFPEINLIKPRCTKPDDAFSDALLIGQSLFRSPTLEGK